MATYVLSDVHGHAAALEKALDMAHLGPGDTLYILGDLVDRGPEPVRCLQLAKDHPRVKVLLGNHESMMLEALDHPENLAAQQQWALNGGAITSYQLDQLEPEARDGLLDWVRDLPLFYTVEVGERLFALVHAGIDPQRVPAHDGPWDIRSLTGLLEAQEPQDLLWIRQGFWDEPTGLLDEKGDGPVVIAGHTPTPYARTMALDYTDSGDDDHGRSPVLLVGLTRATDHYPDKVDIDCGAAMGYPHGHLALVDLTREKARYIPIEKGE